MVSNKLIQFKFACCDRWCITIGDGGWDVFPVLEMCFWEE